MKVKNSKTHIEEEPDPAPSPLGPLEIDYDEYLPYLDGVDMTDEQKRECLDTLWQMMGHFVDEAFDHKK